MIATTPRYQTELTTTTYQVEVGCAHPLGAKLDKDGVNFSIFSEHATAIELLLFDKPDDPEPIQIIELNPRLNKTFHFWHIYVRGLKPRSAYAYRVDGPQDLHGAGHRFNKNKVLIDPYSKGNTNAFWNRIDAVGPQDNLATSMRSVVIDISDYDWEGDRPINRPMSETIIYELHVGGFTKSPDSGCFHSGTFSGIIEKIPYLQELGITAVELLPIFDFDEKEIVREVNGKPLKDYWGYNPHSFFAPEISYCYSPAEKDPITEFRDMVKALHKAGIEVILDVVFNHTSEGNHQGPTINFKGLGNSIHYHLVPFNKQYYMDYSGCGNTVNCNHPMVEKLIVDCLEFWVKEMASGLMKGLSSPVVKTEYQWSIRQSYGTLKHPKFWLTPKSWLRLGMPPDCIKLATSLDIVGRNGTDASETTSASLSRGKKEWSGQSLGAFPEVPISTKQADIYQSTALISLLVMMGSLSMIWSRITTSTMKLMARIIKMVSMTI